MAPTAAARRADLADPSSPHAVEDGIFRALVWLRLIVTANMLGFAVVRWEGIDHQRAGVATLVVLVVWSGFVSWAYATASRRTPAVFVADLAIAVGALAVTPWLKGEEFGATVPGFWVMTVVLAWGAHWRTLGGTVAAAAVALADLAIRWPDITESNYGNIFLLLIGGPIVGYLAGVLRRLAAERDAAQREAALAEERARLSRVVHDGVLQVLALVQRRGPDLGPDGVELGRLAGQQEVALRALVQVRSVSRTPRERASLDPSAPAEADVAAAVGELATRRMPVVNVAAPGHPVLLPTAVAGELVAAVGACLDNVALHVGEQATAWVLLEELPDQVVVTVRDEGRGIPAGRLAEAEAEGRLGVVGSIVGRLRDLGGTATCDSEHGTEWELTVPRRPA